MAKGKEVAVTTIQDNYPMLSLSGEDIQETIEINFEGEDVTARDMFVEVPSPNAGDEEWTIKTSTGKKIFEKLTGVIIHIGNTRGLFEGEFGKGSNIPLCSSNNGVQGEGNPGGACAACEEAKFSPNGTPPACKQKKPIYMLVPAINGTFPVVINTTAPSFPALKKFRRQLFHENVKPFEVEVTISLKAGKTKNDLPKSEMQFDITNNLQEDKMLAAKILAYRENFMPWMKPVTPQLAA